MTFISSARLLLSLLVVFATLFETSRAFAPSRYASGSSQVLLGTNLRHFRFGSKLKSSTSRLYRRGSLVLRAIDVKEGNLVEFTSKNGEALLGVVQGPDPKQKKALIVVDADESERSVLPKAIRHVVEGVSGADSPKRSAALAKSHTAAAANLLADQEAINDDLEAAWEVALDLSEGGPLLLSDLVDLLPTSSQASEPSEVRYAAYALLESPLGKLFFKSKGEGGVAFVPRDQADSLQLRSAYANAASAQAQQAALRGKVQAAMDGKEVWDTTCGGDEELVAAMAAVERLGCYHREPLPAGEKEVDRSGAPLPSPEDTAAKAESAATLTLAKGFLKDSLGRKATAESAQRLLVGLGVWDHHENLELIKRRTPVAFNEELLAAAKALMSGEEGALPLDEDALKRRDLRHLRAFAIDSADTTEVDDAISIEEMSDQGDGPRTRIWIHVADPTRFIASNSLLDDEAQKRKSTLYLPHQQVPMFPHQLAADLLSLGPNTCALSFGCILHTSEEEDGKLKAEELVVCCSTVNVERLTYDEVDAALASSPSNIDAPALEALQSLASVANRRRKWRASKGSMEAIAPLSLPDCELKAWKTTDSSSSSSPPNNSDADRSVDVGHGWRVKMTGRGRAESASNTLVTECMLLAGEAAATLACEANLPLPFRSQETRAPRGGVMTADEEVAEILALPEGYARTWRAIRRMGPSEVGSEPCSHEGLGLPCYVQATSPIRRYGDLCVHRQLKALLRGDSALPFPQPPNESQPNADSDIVRIARDDNGAREVMRAADNYWKSEYFKKCAGATVEAVCISDKDSRSNAYKVVLPSLGVLADYRGPCNLELGESLSVALSASGDVV